MFGGGPIDVFIDDDDARGRPALACLDCLRRRQYGDYALCPRCIEEADESEAAACCARCGAFIESVDVLCPDCADSEARFAAADDDDDDDLEDSL